MGKTKSIFLILAAVLVFGQISVDLVAKNQNLVEEVLEETSNEELIEELPLEEEDIEEIPDIEEPYLGSASATIIVSEEILEIGRIAQYQLYINIDGRKDVYNDVIIQVKLPEQIDENSVSFNQNLEELKLRGILPQYNEKDKTLNYYFEQLEGGFESSILLNLETKNGTPLNGVELPVKLLIVADDMLLSETEGTVSLVANQNMSLTNKLKGILSDGELQDRLSIKYLDEAVFSVGSSVSKFNSGSLALKEGSKVKVSYTFAEGLTYLRDTSGVLPKIDNQTITWEFDANTNEDEEYFYNKNFDVSFKVEGDLRVFSKISHTASASLEFIDDSVNSYDSVATVMISPNFEYQLEGLTGGGAYASIFSGPSDHLGNPGWISNDDPELTDGALLGWNFYLTSLGAVHPVNGLNAYNVFFHPDENINIRNIYSGDFYYRPSSAFAEAGLQPIEEPVYASVSIKYRDSDEWYQGESAIRPSTYYSAAQLGIEANRKVETIWFHFHDNETHIFWDDIGFGSIGDSSVLTLPAGLTTTNLRIWTTVEENYVGSIESQAAIAYSGWNGNGNRVDYQSKYVPEALKVSHFNDFGSDFESRLMPKTAQIVEPPTGVSRYVKSNAYFAKSKNNLLETGDNKLILEITNDSASLSSLKGPFETYVLIEEGIELGNLSDVIGGDVSIIDDNYKNTGKTLLKVVFLSTNITISYKSSVSIPVNITDKVPYNANVEIYGYLHEDFEVSDVSNTNGTFTVKELDLDDFNGNGIEEEIFVTRNQYTYINAYEFYATLGLSQDGTGYGKSINVYDDGFNMMQIGIVNPDEKPISDLVLIGVLPTVDDTYVVNDTVRNSKFSVSLTEPIPLSEAMAKNFEIYYSTSKEPLVEGVLDANTSQNLPSIKSPSRVDDQPWLRAEDVEDFSTIRSYKILMKKGAKVYRDTNLEFIANVKVDAHDLTGDEPIDERIAYSSFAVGINNGSVFETSLSSMIYTVKPSYTINAKDVIMTLTDVKKLIKDGTLDQEIINKALPFVSKDGVPLIDAEIIMSIINRPDIFEVGTYDLSFTFHPNTYSIDAINIQTKLIIVDEDLGVSPTPVEPEEVPSEQKPESIETGVVESTVDYLIVLGIALLVLLVLKQKRESLKN